MGERQTPFNNPISLVLSSSSLPVVFIITTPSAACSIDDINANFGKENLRHR
jgi:hypothetical protein